MLPFRMFVANTVTGKIVADVPFVGVPQWESRLNASGSLTVKVPLGAMSKRDFHEFSTPWRWTWGFAYGSHILQAGPTVTDRYSDSEGPPTADVACVGLMAIFSHRVLINPSWVKGQDVAAVAADINYANLTLRTIAKRMVQGDLARVGHSLPIALPADDGPSIHQRFYPGYDLADIGERLTQLTQVIDGPEVEFRPAYTTDDQTAIQWEMRLGGPRLGQMGFPHVWDYGAALTHVDWDRDGSQQTMSHFQKGNGSERALLTAYADDTSSTSDPTYPHPVLETVGTDTTSVELQSSLNARAAGYVATHARSIVNRGCTIRIDGTDGRGKMTRSPSIDLIRLGDTSTHRLADHRRIPDGVYGERVIGMNSASDLYTANLVTQPTE